MKIFFGNWKTRALVLLVIIVAGLGFRSAEPALVNWKDRAGAEKPPVDLVVNGKSQYVIVVMPGSSPQVQRAATLMQKYVEKMSGCKLPIVGQTPSQDKGIFIREVDGLKYDGYRINTQADGSITIEGGKNKGCIYGSIRILDKYLGCHLYSPKYKVIPES